MTGDETPELTANQIAGRYLAELRTHAGLTQSGVAAAAGIDEKVYNALERGRRPISMLYAERLAGPLSVGDPHLLLPPAEIQDQDTAAMTLHDRLEAIAAGIDRTVRNQERGLKLLREIRDQSLRKAAQSDESPSRAASKRRGS